MCARQISLVLHCVTATTSDKRLLMTTVDPMEKVPVQLLERLGVLLQGRSRSMFGANTSTPLRLRPTHSLFYKLLLQATKPCYLPLSEFRHSQTALRKSTIFACSRAG